MRRGSALRVAKSHARSHVAFLLHHDLFAHFEFNEGTLVGAAVHLRSSGEPRTSHGSALPLTDLQRVPSSSPLSSALIATLTSAILLVAWGFRQDRQTSLSNRLGLSRACVKRQLGHVRHLEPIHSSCHANHLSKPECPRSSPRSIRPSQLATILTHHRQWGNKGRS